MEGMTIEQARKAAAIVVVRVEEPAPGVFWLVYHSPNLRVDYTVTDAARFREVVAAGLDDSLPADVFALHAAQCTRVVNVKRGESYDVYIGRTMPGGKYVNRGWGNPFRAPQAIERYKEWIQHQPALLARLPELRGKVLGCWCAPDGGLPGNLDGTVCHGEILAALADATAERTAEVPSYVEVQGDGEK